MIDTLTEYQTFQRIGERCAKLFEELGLPAPDPRLIASYVQIVHHEIMPLRLSELLEADDFNFAHDVAGIHRHLRIGKQPRAGGSLPATVRGGAVAG